MGAWLLGIRIKNTHLSRVLCPSARLSSSIPLSSSEEGSVALSSELYVCVCERKRGRKRESQTYRIAGKFGRELNLAVWRSILQLPNFLLAYIRMEIPYQTATFKPANILPIAILGSTTKFNFRQYFRLYGNLQSIVWYLVVSSSEPMYAKYHQCKYEYFSSTIKAGYSRSGLLGTHTRDLSVAASGGLETTASALLWLT